jgi:hypothetical protein
MSAPTILPTFNDCGRCIDPAPKKHIPMCDQTDGVAVMLSPECTDAGAIELIRAHLDARRLESTLRETLRNSHIIHVLCSRGFVLALDFILGHRAARAAVNLRVVGTEWTTRLQCTMGSTALAIACSHLTDDTALRACSCLVLNGANMFLARDDGLTPLFVAVEHGLVHTSTFLLERMLRELDPGWVARPNGLVSRMEFSREAIAQVTTSPATLLSAAARSSKGFRTCRWLLSDRCRCLWPAGCVRSFVNAAPVGTFTPLLFAVTRDDGLCMPTVRLLLETGGPYTSSYLLDVVLPSAAGHSRLRIEQRGPVPSCQQHHERIAVEMDLIEYVFEKASGCSSFRLDANRLTLVAEWFSMLSVETTQSPLCSKEYTGCSLASAGALAKVLRRLVAHPGRRCHSGSTSATEAEMQHVVRTVAGVVDGDCIRRDAVSVMIVLGKFPRSPKHVCFVLTHNFDPHIVETYLSALSVAQDWGPDQGVVDSATVDVLFHALHVQRASHLWIFERLLQICAPSARAIETLRERTIEWILNPSHRSNFRLTINGVRFMLRSALDRHHTLSVLSMASDADLCSAYKYLVRTSSVTDWDALGFYSLRVSKALLSTLVWLSKATPTQLLARLYRVHPFRMEMRPADAADCVLWVYNLRVLLKTDSDRISFGASRLLPVRASQLTLQFLWEGESHLWDALGPPITPPASRTMCCDSARGCAVHSFTVMSERGVFRTNSVRE